MSPRTHQVFKTYEEDTTDPHRLDGDDDGIACEALQDENDSPAAITSPFGFLRSLF